MPIKTLRIVLLAAAAATLFAAMVPLASGATSGRSKSRDPVIVKTKLVPGLGKILVNNVGRTLYMFEPDRRRKVTCVKECATIWPPLKLDAGAKAIGRGGVKQRLLGSDRDPAGGRVVTYNRWPLYLYLGDRKAGTASGQALDENGGYWYVITPSGALIKHKPTKPGGTGTSTAPTTTPSTTTTTTTTPYQCTDEDNDGDQNAGGPDDGDGCI